MDEGGRRKDRRLEDQKLRRLEGEQEKKTRSSRLKAESLKKDGRGRKDE